MTSDTSDVAMHSHYLSCVGREIHVLDWQPIAPQRGCVLAWHGLARTGRDFDELAQHLAGQGWRVVCPDTLGRGFSQWSPDPKHEYCLAFYARIARQIVEQLNLHSIHWVGTSMGGAIGTVCASGLFEPSLVDRIKTLTLNDNAPQLAAPAIERIKAYAGQPPDFASQLELEGFFRRVYQPFGQLTDDQWRRLAQTSARRLPNGRWTPHYDPAMVQQFTHYPDDYQLWMHWDLLSLPVLCLRGAQSDLVLPETIEQMRTRGPGARECLQVIEVPGCGHAPALNVPEQIRWIENFISGGR